jgi:hypothetical protein
LYQNCRSSGTVVRGFTAMASVVSIVRPGDFRHAFEDAVEYFVSGLAPLLTQEWLRKGYERTGVAFSVGQVGGAVGDAVEDEEVLAVDNPTETTFAEPSQPVVRCRS